MSFSQFLKKKTDFIPVTPVEFPSKRRKSVNEISDVFDVPNEAPLAEKIIKVSSNVKSIKPPLVRKVSPRNLTGNVRDIKKLENEETGVFREKTKTRVSEKKIIEIKLIEQSRPKREVTMATRTKLAEVIAVNTDIVITKIANNVKEERRIPEVKEIINITDTMTMTKNTLVTSAATPVIKRTSGRLITGNPSNSESHTPLQTPIQSEIQSTLRVKSVKVKRSNTNGAVSTARNRLIKAKPKETKENNKDDDIEFEIEVSEDSGEESFEDIDEAFEEVKIASKKSRSAKSKPSRKSTKSMNSARWERIKQVLKAGGTIEALPGRIDEFDWIKRTVLGLLESALGGCLYISGVPGTGKTATTHRTLDALSLDALKGQCPDFDFVEINGMRLSDPGQAYSILARSIFKKKVPTNGALALKKLESHFKEQQKSKQAGRPCVVLLDELDLLLRKRQSLLYHFFEWPNWTNSQLIVITIANTMDLPERFLSNRISSRLGLTRYNFKPYDHAALSNIIEHQLKDYVKYLGKDAIQLCARKVSAVSGDARRAVNLAKRAVDYFRSATQEELQARITGRQVSEEKVPEASHLSAVNLRLMDIILKEALMANPVEVIGKLSKHQRIMLLSIILARKRAEEEISIRGGTKIIGGKTQNNNVTLTVNRVLDQHFQLCRTHQYHPLPSLQELYVLLESLESLRLLRCMKFRESGPESVIQLLVHEEDIRKGLGDDQSLKKYIREQ